jgi:hypothetical protein
VAATSPALADDGTIAFAALLVVLAMMLSAVIRTPGRTPRPLVEALLTSARPGRPDDACTRSGAH